MQSAVAGRRWRREKRRTCVRVSVSAALPKGLSGWGYCTRTGGSSKRGWLSCVGRHVWRIVELHNMHFFIGHPPKIYSPTHIDLLPDNCPESNPPAPQQWECHRRCPSSNGFVSMLVSLAPHRAELWVVYAAGDRLNAIFHCNSSVFLVFFPSFFFWGLDSISEFQ